MRDAPYAKRARAIVVNNVIGAGVGMQAQVKNSRDNPHASINEDIEDAWELWAKADSCHTGGTLHFSDFERACLSEVFTAGEVFIRKHYRTFGNSRVPLALELIEAERLADEFNYPQGSAESTRLGIEVDAFGRPVNYYVRTIHPGELRLTDQGIRFEKVPASEIIHLRKVERWPQTRGEPWMHSVMRKLNDMDGYTEAEIIAARSAACYMGIWETPDPDSIGEPQSDGTQEVELAPGMMEKGLPGEKFVPYMPNRPNSALDPFMRYMVREVATGIPGMTYESLSGDYSQSNFSSSRLGVIDSRDDWRVLQKWWARTFREPLLRDWMQAAVLGGAIPSISVESWALSPERFLEVAWKFRGWTWFDPPADIAAYKDAVRCGFTTVAAVIEQTGNGADIEDVLEQRRQELDDMAAQSLSFESDPVAFPPRIATAQNQAQPDPAKGPADVPMDPKQMPSDGSMPSDKVVPMKGRG
jgi:lambda family phage portal protein